jgi:hypothetical protein
MNLLKNSHWFEIGREPEGEQDLSKPGKGPFWRKQEKVAKHGARLRGWEARESNGDAAQMPYVANGAKGYTTTSTTLQDTLAYSILTGRMRNL